MENDNDNLTKRERKRLNREKKRAEEAKKRQKEGLTKKLIFAALAIGGAIVLWNILQSGNSSSDTSTTTDYSSVDSVRDTDHVEGNPNAKLVLIEYGDFQCPACSQYSAVINEISQKYQDNLAIVFRQFPLKATHKNSQISAQASEAAAKQNAFWGMHDLLYKRQSSWVNVRDPRQDFIDYAQELGLDTAQFETDMNSDEVKNIVDNAYNEAIALDLNSTPTFILNGQKLSVAPSTAAFESIIDDALSQLPDTNTEATNSGETQTPDAESGASGEMTK